MAGERLAELAVDAVADYLTTYLPTYLTAVETARSMTAGYLAPPVEIKRADLPEYGGATPLIEVFENKIDPINIENRVYAIDVTVIMTKSGDADIPTDRQFVRDYTTALVDCFNATLGRTLNSRVGSCLLSDVSFAQGRGSNASHLHHVAIGLQIRIFDS